MELDELRRSYGAEYPAALMFEGERVPLSRESRFLRAYSLVRNGRKHTHLISRLMDGSASMTAEQLRMEWPSWTRDMRMEFCQGVCWLSHQADYADMLRFVVEHGRPMEWSVTACCVAVALPRDEAFLLLARALDSVEPGEASNLMQGLAQTKHPEARRYLRKHLEKIWNEKGLWADDPFCNWRAYDAACCIKHLIECGDEPSELEEKVRRLAGHQCEAIRDSCRRFLGKYYEWLNTGG